MFGTLAPGGLRDDGPHHSSEEIAVGAGLASTRQGFDDLVAHGFAPIVPVTTTAPVLVDRDRNTVLVFLFGIAMRLVM